MNYLWGAMLLAGVVCGAVTGNLSGVTQAALDSSREAVTLALTLLGVTAFWNGILNIAEKSGIVERFSRRLNPAVTFLFPRLPENHPSRKLIAMNMIANFLGLGNAATPMGLRAMESLADLERERGDGRFSGVASREMCTFLIVNISSLQLIPMNMIAYRSQYGSVSPGMITGPAIAATAASTLAAVIFCRLMEISKETLSDKGPICYNGCRNKRRAAHPAVPGQPCGHASAKCEKKEIRRGGEFLAAQKEKMGTFH